MQALEDVLGSDRVFRSTIDRLAFSRDASLYRYVPQAVVRPQNREDILKLLRWCNNTGTPCTFRTAGTSLSGQAVTDGIIVDLTYHWSGAEVLDGGALVCAQPGITGGRVNALLAPYGRKIGPDPASINAAMIGGIVANNASGMCCGTANNSYNTIESMKFILANGFCANTSAPGEDDRFSAECPELYAEILRTRDTIRSSEELVQRIQSKYRIKNTMGYSLNAFLDEDLPLHILRKLLVGSEGTLGFIEEVTYRTIPEARRAWTSIVVYDTLEMACDNVDMWRDAGAAAVELMDDASLHSFAHLPHTPNNLRITQSGCAALLVEFQDVEPPAGYTWSTNAAERALLWKLRKGLMPTVGAQRSAGTTMINEDVAVPSVHLAALVRDLQHTFHSFGYTDAVIFGHAKDGNLHFVVNQLFASDEDLQRYAQFMDAVAEIVVGKYDGSLKAEHGTGRNMAPYVEMEWGKQAYSIMQTIKTILDPNAILNRNVLLNSDPLVHVANIKDVVQLVDANGTRTPEDLCIECGFCEHVCPTRTYTLTPRQRITLARESAANARVAAEIEADYRWQAVESCVADSMCSLVCPVGIDTGAMMLHHKHTQRSAAASWVAKCVSERITLARAIARTMSVFVPKATLGKGHAAHKDANPEVLLLQTCPPTILRTTAIPNTVADVTEVLLQRAGIAYETIADSNLCCGQPFASKGFPHQARRVQERTIRRVAAALNGRNLPVAVLTSTCASALSDSLRRSGITMVDQVGLAEMILSRLQTTPVDGPIVVHPGCGIAKSGSVERFIAIAQQCSNDVFLPPHAGCCGMGGDGGLRYPQRVDAALHNEIAELPSDSRMGISANAMCEHALSARTGIAFGSLLHLVELATRY